ncbi:putative C-S lyase [Alteromonadaceae bacterium M269]|nr:putative C-S lyase [Alteromonadaceae bacterium M269]
MNFDQQINRNDNYSFKWNRYKDRDILPMWVADTDFKCAEPITQALHKSVEHGVYGYVLPNEYEPAKVAIKHWLSQQHDWDIELDWIVWTAGVVPAFNMACKGFCQPGDKVMVQAPNYPPMRAAPALNQLERIDIGTVKRTNEASGEKRWTLDFEALEQHASDPACKLFIMCNPMNPTGSVMTEEELAKVDDICERHGVMICSDEIHCDLILDQDAKHIPAGLLKNGDKTITLMAASKTFNIAGLGTSFAIIPDSSIRRRFVAAGAGITPWVTIMGLVGTEVAFTQCDDWYQQQIAYLRDNRNYLFQQVNRIAGLSMLRPQATYLAWIDAKGLGVESPYRYFEDKGVGPSPGADFGNKDFVRINFGCPKQTIEQALLRLNS